MTAQTGRLNYPRHALIVTIPVSWGNKHTLSQDDLGKVVEAIEKIEQPVLHETLNEDDDEPIGERNEMVEALEIMVLRASKGRDEDAGQDFAWSGVWIQVHLESETLGRWSCEGSSETRCSFAQGDSKTLCIQALEFHEEGDRIVWRTGLHSQEPA